MGILLTIEPASTMFLPIIHSSLSFDITWVCIGVVRVMLHEVMRALFHVVCRGIVSLNLNFGYGWNLSASRPGHFDSGVISSRVHLGRYSPTGVFTRMWIERL